jgi:hypothetical protein
MPGRLVDSEIGRSRKRWCHAAEPETAAAVSAQDVVLATGGSLREIKFFAQGTVSGSCQPAANTGDS